MISGTRMQPFAFLTTQGRARRLRALAFEALKEYDLDVERLSLVNNETNCTFRIDTADGQIYALRVSLPDVHSKKEIEAEIDWQLALAKDSNIAVPRPIPAISGQYVVTAEHASVPEPRHCVVFSWLRGRDLEEVASPESFHEFGGLVARLHQHGSSFQPARPDAIPRVGTLYPLGDAEKILDDDTAALFPDDGYSTLLEMRSAAKRELEWLFDGRRSPQVIHRDLHWWNVMSYRGRLQIIDFEDIAWGFPVQDIAITLYYTAGRKNYPDLQEAFQAGYEGIGSWPEMYPGQLEIHMVHRAVDLFNFVLSSTYREHRELLANFVRSFQEHHNKVFESWRSQFDEGYYR